MPTPCSAGPRVHLCRSADESKALNHVTGPAVIISSSGMMDAGRIVHHLKYRLPHPHEHDRARRLHGRRHPRPTAPGRRQIAAHARPGSPGAGRRRKSPGLSGHADRSDLLRWLEPLPQPKQVFLVHGEPQAGRSAGRHAPQPNAAGTSPSPISANRTNWCKYDGACRRSHAIGNRIAIPMKQQDTAEANRQAILSSPSYRLAEYDFDFLKRDDIRHVRMTLELLKTETLLRDNNVKATVVVFGSARIVPQDVAEVAAARSDRSGREESRAIRMPSAPSQRAESVLAKSHFYDEARDSAGSFRPSARSKAATIS